MEQDGQRTRAVFDDPASLDDLAEMYLAAVSGVLASLKIEGDERGFASDVTYLLAQAQVRWLTSALRYWTQIASIISTQGADAAGAIRPDGRRLSPEARRLIVLDKARAALREISELSLTEARLLQRDLMEIEADLRATLPEGPRDRDAPHRYAKRKE